MRRLVLFIVMVFAAVASSAQPRTPSVPTPEGIKPGSITCEDVPYPFPVSYLPLTLYGQDLRIAFMDVPPLGQPNGHVVVLFHGNNFAGFYFGSTIEALRKEGFRVIAPDQIGYGRSSKPIIPYNFHDMARNTHLILESLKIDKAMIVGHSMGGMLAARFATQFPGDDRAARALQPDWPHRSAVRPAVGERRRGLQADARLDVSDHPRQHHALRRAQRGGVDAGVRDLYPRPLRLDAQRRLAAPRHGPDADQPGAVSRSGRRRLGAHQGADAGVRRRGR